MIRNIKNTFAPNVKNEYLSAYDIVIGLQFSAFHYSQLSDEAKTALKEWRKTNPGTPIRKLTSQNSPE